MKTYDDLLKPSLQPSVVIKCMLDASKHKRRRPQVVASFTNVDAVYRDVALKSLDHNYYPEPHQTYKIKDGTNGKIRTIEKPKFNPDQIIHHVIIEPFKKVVLNGLYEQTYGCIPKQFFTDAEGKKFEKRYGPHAALKRLKKWIQVDKKIFVAELDIHKAYDSVNLDILMTKLRKVIKDEDWLNLVERFIKGNPKRINKDRGLVLGHYTSPWFFNFYLKDFDHFAASFEGIRYLRYADNFFLVSTNKRKLRNAVISIQQYLTWELKLLLNPSSMIYRFEYVDKKTGKTRGRAVNALGFVIHSNRVTVRKSILRGIRRKALRLHKKGMEKCNWYDAQSFVSRLSWFRKTDTVKYFNKYIKPIVDIKYLKSLISAHSKKEQPKYNAIWRYINDRVAQSKWLAIEQAAGV